MAAFQPRYCARCGALLGKSRPRLMGYNEYTGAAWYQVDYKCPNARWWKLWHTKITITNDAAYSA